MESSPSSEPASASQDLTFWCRTLGHLALYRSERLGEPIMQAGKPLALVAYLALAPDFRAERDHVAQLLWPGASSSDSRHSLRQALYRLRAATGGRELVRADDGHLILLPGLRFDCLELEAAVLAGDLEPANELVNGHFLADFAIPESREFEEWAESQRTRFRELWAEAATKLVEAKIDDGDPDLAILIAERLVAFRPFDEEPIRLLMLALAAAGRHAIALSRFVAYSDQLTAEGEAPSDLLKEHVEELERFVRHRKSRLLTELPFVGRTEEWSVLERVWAEATAANGATVLIEGAAGLGKTRLIEELRARVQAGDGLVVSAKCYEPEQSVPYGSIADALAGLIERPELNDLSPAWLAEAARLFPEIRERHGALPEPPGSEGSGASKRRLHQALARCLEAVARETPVLVTLDDLHWADPASLEVLHFLSHHLRNRPVLMLCTYRPAELSPAARGCVRSLCASGLARVLALAPLTEDEVSDLMISLATFEEPELEAALCGQLYNQSGGNPLFLAELLDALSRDRILFHRNGRWIWSGETRLSELPQTIGKLLADRIDRLEPWMRACVECLAVAADEVPVDLLARAAGISEPRAELALSVLEEERLIKRTGPGSFELIHDEFRRLVYHGIPDERRALLHATVGTSLEDLGEARRPGGAARLVYHFNQAGDVARARRYALLAAGEASALSAPEAMRMHLEMAAAHSPRPLPPRSGAVATPEEASWWRRWRARVLWAAAAGLSGVLLTAAALSWVPGSGSAPGADFRQGSLYLGTEMDVVPSHVVVWPSRAEELARIERLDELPGPFTAAVMVLPITEAGETHSKLFRIVGSDTVQMTFGQSDDALSAWSPDGREVLFHRGWRSEQRLYTSNLYRLRLEDERLERVTDTRYQDVYGTWSPVGNQVAFARDSLGIWNAWISDYDGAHALNLTSTLGLPTRPSWPAFSPDGSRLALLFAADGSASATIVVVDLAAATSRRLAGLGGFSLAAEPLWSPDSRWLAFRAQREGEWRLWAVALDGTSGPVPMTEPLQGLRPVAWTGEKPSYVERVEIRVSDLELTVYAGVSAQAVALTAAGDTVDVPVRWSVADTAVAMVDDRGFVRGRSPGRTQIVASAGGFRADTSNVTVESAALDTLMVEDWAGGIDPTRWVLFGSPEAVVVPDVPGVGTHLFWNNGDYNHTSGAFTVQRFDQRETGLTVEVDGWVDFTGGHWQLWEVFLLMGEPEFVNDVELGGTSWGFRMEGHSPVFETPHWSCGTVLRGEWTPEEVNRKWLRYALQLRPDGVLECYVDGQLLGRAVVPADQLRDPIGVALSGVSEGAEIYHGSMVVTRGLKY